MTRRTIGMAIDHTYHGEPIEYGFVRLVCSETVTKEQIEIAERNQQKKLESMAKRMPHSFWKRIDHDHY